MPNNNETYDEWFQRVHAAYPYIQANHRYGQYLYNSLPDRFMGNIPFGYDPYYNDDNIEIFLLFIKNRW